MATQDMWTFIGDEERVAVLEAAVRAYTAELKEQIARTVAEIELLERAYTTAMQSPDSPILVNEARLLAMDLEKLGVREMALEDAYAILMRSMGDDVVDELNLGWES